MEIILCYIIFTHKAPPSKLEQMTYPKSWLLLASGSPPKEMAQFISLSLCLSSSTLNLRRIISFNLRGCCWCFIQVYLSGQLSRIIMEVDWIGSLFGGRALTWAWDEPSWENWSCFKFCCCCCCRRLRFFSLWLIDDAIDSSFASRCFYWKRRRLVLVLIVVVVPVCEHNNSTIRCASENQQQQWPTVITWPEIIGFLWEICLSVYHHIYCFIIIIIIIVIFQIWPTNNWSSHNNNNNNNNF